jgi:hypothetical protein
MAGKCELHSVIERRLDEAEDISKALFKMAIPVWVRGLLVLVLLALGGWVYSAQGTFATKVELKDLKTDTLRVQREIKESLKEIKDLVIQQKR